MELESLTFFNLLISFDIDFIPLPSCNMDIAPRRPFRFFYVLEIVYVKLEITGRYP